MFSKAQFVRGLFLAILCLAAVGEAENLVVNPGFETAESTYGAWPSIYGDWNGDYSAIVSSSSGITPMGGSAMLQFRGTSLLSGSGSANASQVFQLIDISGYQSLVASGNAKAEASVYYNRVAGDAQTDTEFNLVVMAYDGLPSTFPTRWEDYGYSSALTYGVTTLFSDSLLTTWEEVEVTLDLPDNTAFLAVNIKANENIFNDSSYPEFDGHFADNVSLQVVPEPATVLLLSVGFAGIISRRKTQI